MHTETEEHPVYKALSVLLNEGSFVRLDLSVLGVEGEALSVGFHIGYDDGSLVIYTNNDSTNAIEFSHDLDSICARELSAALIAWADWSEANPIPLPTPSNDDGTNTPRSA